MRDKSLQASRNIPLTQGMQYARPHLLHGWIDLGVLLSGPSHGVQQMRQEGRAGGCCSTASGGGGGGGGGGGSSSARTPGSCSESRTIVSDLDSVDVLGRLSISIAVVSGGVEAGGAKEISVVVETSLASFAVCPGPCAFSKGSIRCCS